MRKILSNSIQFCCYCGHTLTHKQNVFGIWRSGNSWIYTMKSEKDGWGKQCINLRQLWQDWMCHSVSVEAAPSPRLWYPRQTLRPWLLPAQSSQPCPAALQNKSNLHLYSLVYTALLTAKVESTKFDTRSKSALWSVAEVAKSVKVVPLGQL